MTNNRGVVFVSWAASCFACACGPTTQGTDADGTVDTAGVGDSGDADAGIADTTGTGTTDTTGDGDGDGDGTNPRCGTLTAIYRDFQSSHPDFESYDGAALKGLVRANLGANNKPQYAPAGATAVTAGEAEFNQWYTDVPGVNQRFEMPLILNEESPGVFVFADDEFFPLDGLGFPEEFLGHNFHFTTEIHASFQYRGQEVFTFTGDDDVWVFVNKKLALDLGGLHGPMSDTIDFDAQASDLGIEVGRVYSLDVFHAERHTTMSNFRIETSIECIVIE